MAYKRRYKKRMPRKAKGATDKKVTVWSDHSVLEKANRALALVNNVRRFINVEVKHHDVVSSTTVPNTGTIIGLSAIAQGDGATNRDGDSIKLLNSTLRFEINTDATEQKNTQMRFILFRGKQEDQSGFSVTEILESASFISPKSYENRFKTKILMDKTYTCALSSNSTTDFSSKYIDHVQKLIGHVQFATGTTSIENGGLYLLMISNQTTLVPTVFYNIRTTFTDN